MVPAMSSSSQPPPKTSESGETDTDAEHPASLGEQSRVAPPNAPTIAPDPTRLPPDLFNRIGPKRRFAVSQQYIRSRG